MTSPRAAIAGVLCLAAVQAVLLGVLLGTLRAPPMSILAAVMLVACGTGLAGAWGWTQGSSGSIPGSTHSEISRRDAQMRDHLADLAHDVRTPLAALKLGLGRVQDQPEVAPLRAEVEHLDALFRNVAALMQLDGTSLPLALRAQDLAPLVQRVVQRGGVLAMDAGVELHGNTDTEAPVVAEIDAVAFEQVLTNLVSNAVKFCEGHVAVLLECTSAEAVIRVLDDGPGLSTLERPAMLGRGVRGQGAVDRGRPGQGLGLAIAVALAERQRGQVSLRPGPEGGTCAELRLPRVALEVEEAS